MKLKNVSRRSFLTTVTAGAAAVATANVVKPWENIADTIYGKSGESTQQLKIGTFDVDATPPVGNDLAYDPMTASWDFSLRARGIVLIGAGKPIVLCAIDWIGIANESQDVFKQSLALAAGTTPGRVAVHTVHQHDAPICDFTSEKILKKNHLPVGCFDGTFARILIKNIQQAISNTLKNLQAVTAVGFGKAPVYEVASNRRIDMVNGKIRTMRGSSCDDPSLRAKPEGLIDPEVSVLSFWNKEKPVAVLSFYATHPQSYYRTGIANPDFPGIARCMRQLAVPDALHIHFNGAGGNIAAGKYNDGSRINRLVLAERMADGMKRAWDHTIKASVSSKNIQWATQPVLLPVNSKTAGIEKEMFKQTGPYLTNNMGRLGWYKRALEGKTIDMNCLAINDNIRVFFVPGELFIEYQLNTKAMAPDKFVAMAAYGDYGPFYIGTKQAYQEGGYEIESSPVTEEAEKVILDTIHSLYRQTE
ncbi:MAG TPA: hypothetical protein DDZ96_00055 [Porphyromonadaceae bacterium]|jgi:hypothetical protein|nr:hypothetical protein [Porphyromonadaceae bacterium]HBL32196.1 hypothetical protein [Porphyromonadaceae bacterium]HBX21702.1 hypothetical protein [Porphyromonadaceae bacterium]HCM21198.1 hypothetical protein [Porphyromonadaceae bacterium]